MRTLGKVGPVVSDIGLGCMGMSDLYGPADEGEGIATVRAAMDAGITLLDTGDYYGMGHNELLLREALRGRSREQVTISVKFGALRDPGGGWLGVDGRPAAVKTFLTYSLRRLGTNYIDIYRLGRSDPVVPIEETVGARRRDRLAEVLGALTLVLSADDLALIEHAVPPGAAAGERYPAAHMAILDSERRVR